MEKDIELLDRVINRKDFLPSILEDTAAEWELAKDLGEYLLRVVPQLLVGHLILARAYRHLNDLPHAIEEVEQCRAIVARGGLAGEVEFLPDLAEEERLLFPKP
jgi:hypothetical protein